MRPPRHQAIQMLHPGTRLASLRLLLFGRRHPRKSSRGQTEGRRESVQGSDRVTRLGRLPGAELSRSSPEESEGSEISSLDSSRRMFSIPEEGLRGTQVRRHPTAVCDGSRVCTGSPTGTSDEEDRAAWKRANR